MNEPRSFRFAIAPFVYGLWMALSFVFNKSATFDSVSAEFAKRQPGEVTAVAALAVVSALPLGFLISTVTVTMLRILSFVSNRHYEAACVTIDAVPGESKGDRRQRLVFQTATLTFRDLPAGLRDWVVRRWDAFKAWANSATGVLLAWATIGLFRDDMGPAWHAATALAAILLGTNSWFAWRQTMGLLEYHAGTAPGTQADALSGVAKAELAIAGVRRAVTAARDALGTPGKQEE